MKSILLFLLISLFSVGTNLAQDSSGILLGPTLYGPTPTSVHVWWHLSAEAADHRVEYGTTEALGMSAVATEATQYPKVLLSGLENGTTYFYRVASGQQRSDIYRFTLPKSDGPLNIVFWADNQSGY